MVSNYVHAGCHKSGIVMIMFLRIKFCECSLPLGNPGHHWSTQVSQIMALD